MTRKYGDELYRSPSTMTSGHISSLQDGASGVDIPDLKRLGKESGFHPVPRRKDDKTQDKAQRDDVAAKDHLSVGASGSKAAGDRNHNKTTNDHKSGHMDRALQMLKPLGLKKKNEQTK